jgi:signal transduction histidine kinase
MSHELRTPLNAIMGFAEAIRDGVAGDPTAEQREFSEDIYQAGRQLLGMINDILDLAKVEAGAMELTLEPCDLAALIDEVVRVARGLARRKGIELRSDVEPRPLLITADSLKIKQVLYNLLSNAIKFTGAAGKVSVEARLGKETAEIRVSDTGIGIAPEDLLTIFDEFRQVDSSLTRKHEGTGLGLALTRRLVELHGGEVGVESELGKGSTFIVTFLRDIVPSPKTEARPA